MSFSDEPISRRTAMAALGKAGAGLLALSSSSAQSSGSLQREDSSDHFAKALASFTAESRAKLRALLTAPDFSGQIPITTVQDIAASEHKTVAALMLKLLPLARAYSHPPISDYHVGAVVRGASGSLYLGFNIEFPGHALGFSVHGEQAALSSAYMHGEQSVPALAITAAPCGHCRQFMNEITPDGEMEIVVEQGAPLKLSSILPMAFGPKDLGRKQGAFPIQKVNLISTAASTARSSDPLSLAALDAAQTSYAPYSTSPSGVAIATRSGRVHEGSYIENVAFNPSLSPLQVALVQLLVAGDEYSAISRVVLAELEHGKISQRSVAEAVMSAVAPSVRLEVVSAEIKS
jgi:cytidine deaminase